jgi:hypothetical protein
MQAPMVVFQLVALVPMMMLGDRVRQLPVRQMAEVIRNERDRVGPEPLGMVGVMKPSLHFYTDQVVFFEGKSNRALVDFADRLSNETTRRGWQATSVETHPTVLVVIDAKTSERSHWQGLEPQVLASHGIYRLWRLDRRRLNARASELQQLGVMPDWRDPRPERY